MPLDNAWLHLMKSWQTIKGYWVMTHEENIKASLGDFSAEDVKNLLVSTRNRIDKFGLSDNTYYDPSYDDGLEITDFETCPASIIGSMRIISFGYPMFPVGRNGQKYIGKNAYERKVVAMAIAVVACVLNSTTTEPSTDAVSVVYEFEKVHKNHKDFVIEFLDKVISFI